MTDYPPRAKLRGEAGLCRLTHGSEAGREGWIVAVYCCFPAAGFNWSKEEVQVLIRVVLITLAKSSVLHAGNWPLLPPLLIPFIFYLNICRLFSLLRTSLWNPEDPVLRKMIPQVRPPEHRYCTDWRMKANLHRLDVKGKNTESGFSCFVCGFTLIITNLRFNDQLIHMCCQWWLASVVIARITSTGGRSGLFLLTHSHRCW